MKLDGDIELAPGYLRVLLERFAADPRLGLPAESSSSRYPTAGFGRSRSRATTSTARVKCYSRECFEAIGGVQERLGWDTIDETYARMRGFTTVSFEDLVSVHHRPWGSADGALRGVTRLGECAYITHYPPTWVALRSLKLVARRPRGIAGWPTSTAMSGRFCAAAIESRTWPTVALHGVSCIAGWRASWSAIDHRSSSHAGLPRI